MTAPALGTMTDTAGRTHRHGSPYDRGSSDRYYGRAFKPHYYRGAAYGSERVTDLTPAELTEYRLGWDEETDRKIWD